MRGVDPKELIETMERHCSPGGEVVKWIVGGESGALTFGPGILPIGALQRELDAFIAEKGGNIDYIHGAEVAVRLAESALLLLFCPRSKRMICSVRSRKAAFCRARPFPSGMPVKSDTILSAEKSYRDPICAGNSFRRRFCVF